MYTSDFIFYWFFGWLIRTRVLHFSVDNYPEPGFPEPGKFRFYDIVNSWKITMMKTRVYRKRFQVEPLVKTTVLSQRSQKLILFLWILWNLKCVNFWSATVYCLQYTVHYYSQSGKWGLVSQINGLKCISAWSDYLAFGNLLWSVFILTMN